MFEQACLHEVFTVNLFWRRPSAWVQQDRSFWAHPRPPASHRQMFAHCRAAHCPVRAVLPNRRYSWQKRRCTLHSAGCAPEPAPPLANEPSRNQLMPPSIGLLPPKQMGTDKCAGNKHAHRLGAPDTRFVSPTQCRPIQTVNAHCWVV